METNERFQMTYSARQQEELQALRKKYAPPEEDKLRRLRALDQGVSRRASAPAISIGVVGTLLLGLGMSLIMTDLGALLQGLALPVGVAAGLVGMALLACAYPLYRRILERERRRAAPEILRLTDELLQ